MLRTDVISDDLWDLIDADLLDACPRLR